jgi:predicted lactoylglutathione lyase
MTKTIFVSLPDTDLRASMAFPVQELGFMYSRALADPDGHLWGAFWMDPAANPPSDGNAR